MNDLIYFVEDDASVNKLIRATLQAHDFVCEGFLEPLSFLSEVENCKPDLVLLDIMLPNMNGLEVLKRLKANPLTSSTPVIILSAKSLEEDIVRGLDLGAADYITKPFGLNEFISRIKSNLRKVSTISTVYSFKEIEVDLVSRVCKVNNNVLELTPKEFDVIELLLSKQGEVVLRGNLMEKIFGYTPNTQTRTLDNHIKMLRNKINAYTDYDYIKTIRGVGYTIK